jgi:iron(II)-dependent oxidoreductase
MKKCFKNTLLILLALTSIQCEKWPDDFPSDAYPDEGPDIQVTPYANPETIIPQTDWIAITPGSYTMGAPENNKYSPEDEYPSHPVTLTKNISVMKYEVTVAQFRKFCEATGVAMPKEPFWGFKNWEGESLENYPVVNVTWKEAKAFAQWMGGRLPTEAEWEYIARANATTKYSGDNSANKVAWSRSNSTDVVNVYENPVSGTITKKGWKPRAVGTLKSNQWKLFDLSGNVMEWCNDWYGSDYYAKSEATDPQGPPEGTFRVLRGGSWYSISEFCSVYNREFIHPGTRSEEIGFRIVKDN